MTDQRDTKDGGETPEEQPFTLDLSLTPDWAREPPTSQRFESTRYDNYDDRGGRGSRDRRPRRPRSDNERQGSRGGRPETRTPRPERREREARRGRSDSGGPRPDGPMPPAGAPAAPRRSDGPPSDRPRPAAREGPSRPQSGGNYRPSGQGQHGPRRNQYQEREEIPDLPVEIRFLPDQKALAGIVRKIQTTHRAYPLRDLARLFLDNPEACLIRLQLKKEAGEDAKLLHCKFCNASALSEEALKEHIIFSHLADAFDSEEIDGDPPTGNFVCVARCGITGKLLGPPNHHSYNWNVQNILRTRVSNMNEETYRNRIEMLHEPELVEQWREEAKTQMVYRVKGGTDEDPSPPLDRQAAEAQFTREHLPRAVSHAAHVAFPASAVDKIPDQELANFVRASLRREMRFPASLFFALRGAFRHKHLYTFKAGQGKGMDFVMFKPPVPLDPAHTVADVRLVLEHIDQTPGCTVGELVAALTGGAPADSPEVTHVRSQLQWLVEKGHLIEYFNGVLATPAEHPFFRHTTPPPGRGRTQGGPRRDSAPRQAPRPKPAAKPAAAPAPEVTPKATASEPEPEATTPEPTPEAATKPVPEPEATTPEPEPEATPDEPATAVAEPEAEVTPDEAPVTPTDATPAPEPEDAPAKTPPSE